MNFLRLYNSIRHQPPNIHRILVPFIHKFLFTNSIYHGKLKKEAEQSHTRRGPLSRVYQPAETKIVKSHQFSQQLASG